MKTLVAAVALAAVVASPAFAQSYDPSVGSGNVNAAPYRTNQTAYGNTPFDARAQTPGLGRGHRAHGAGHRSHYTR